MYQYKCKIVRWVDGDTVDVVIDVGFKLSFGERVRIAGIDTPEVNSSNALLRNKALAAKARCEQLAPATSVLLIQTAKDVEKYGRWLASITLADGRDLATVLVQEGLAVPYDGGAKIPEAVAAQNIIKTAGD